MPVGFVVDDDDVIFLFIATNISDGISSTFFLELKCIFFSDFPVDFGVCLL